MNKIKSDLLTRRRALASIGVLAASPFLSRLSVFGMTPSQSKLRFTVLGDWGTGDNAAGGIASQILSAHKANPLDLVIAAGDNIYPDGSGRRFVKGFEQPFGALLKEQVKFHAVLGNHDVRDGRSDQCQYPLFNMGGQCYYTLTKCDGLVDFFMLDSTDFDMAQRAWTERALKASTAKWKIAVFHHPLYSSGRTHGSTLDLRKELEPLFIKYRVRAVFSGHDHTYERTKLVHGIQYFVTGAGGKVRKGDVDMKSPFRAFTYDEDNHFMEIEVSEASISFKAISRSGLVIDSGAIA